MNVLGWVTATDGSAEFVITFNAVDNASKPVATLGTVKVGDPDINQRLTDMFQSFRMGARFGVQDA